VKKPKPACDPADHVHRGAPLADAASLEGAAQLLRAMGDAQRLRLLEYLKSGERCVAEIVSVMGDKASTVSQRLKLLRNEGLIRRRRSGTHLFYSLADRHVADLIQTAREHAQELEALAASKPHESESD
jgi:DNA-binding transcriptional ArsR family regulator